MGTERRKTTVMLAAILTATMLCAGAVDAIAGTGGAPAASAQASSSGVPSSSVSTRAVATWFGPGFYGKQTACGQILTPEVLGVAHRTLPCGTLVRLSYRGHSMVVPVIDRGPYAHGVTWDLTAGAAHALALAGTAHVRALLVGEVANTPLLGAPPGSPASGATGGNAAG
jgi:rare lipoprotein A (peptidoglycan hydrolase)